MARAPSTQGNPLVDNPALKTDLEKVADHVTEIDSVATAIEDGSFGAVHTDLGDIRTVGQNIEDVSLLAEIQHKLGMLADDLSNVDAVATSLGEVGNVSNNMATVLLVHARMADLMGITSSLDNIDAVALNEANINSVQEAIPEITTVVSHMADIHFIAQYETELTAIYDNLEAVLSIGTNIDALLNLEENLDVILDAATYVEQINENLAKVEAAEANVIALEASVTSLEESARASEGVATTKASEAAQSATAAHADRLASESAQGAAETAETNAGISEINAKASETAAKNAETSVMDSEAIVTEGATTAVNAKNAAVTAQGLAETAATNAGTSATNAAASEGNAGTSAANAATSEGNAADSATAAGTAELHAKESETNSAASEGVALAARNESQSARDESVSAKDTAVTKADEASASALAASGSAGAAGTSESNAASSEGVAVAQAAIATTKASEALASEGVATTKAGEAKADADRAEEAKNSLMTQHVAPISELYEHMRVNKERYAASGFVEFGKHLAGSYVSINEGMYVAVSGAIIPNELYLGSNYSSKAGESESDFPRTCVAGVVTDLLNISSPSLATANTVKFPQASDGTVTYDSATGTIINHKTYVDPKYGTDAGGDVSEAVARAFEGTTLNGDGRKGAEGWGSILGGAVSASNGEIALTIGASDTGNVYLTNQLSNEIDTSAQYIVEFEVVGSSDFSRWGYFDVYGTSLDAGHVRRTGIVRVIFTPTNAASDFRIGSYGSSQNATITIKNLSVKPVTQEVVTERVDFAFQESFLRKVYDAETDTYLGQVYPNGCIQSKAADFEGVATTDDTNRPDTFFAQYHSTATDGTVIDTDTESRGLGVWPQDQSDEWLEQVSGTTHHVYRMPNGDLVQWCTRIRTVAGAGNGDWENVDPNLSGSNRTLNYGDSSFLQAQGDADYVTATSSGWLSDTYFASDTPQDNPNEIGCFSPRGVSTVAVDGLCFALPLFTVSRLNQGAYHPSLNEMGTKHFGNGAVSPHWEYLWSNTSWDVHTKADCFGEMISTTPTGAIGLNSGRPDDKLYDAIYPSGQGGVIDDRLSAWDMGSPEEAAKQDAKVKNGSFRGEEYLPFTGNFIDNKQVAASSSGWIKVAIADFIGDISWMSTSSSTASPCFGSVLVNGSPININGAFYHTQDEQVWLYTFPQVRIAGTDVTSGCVTHQTNIPVEGNVTQGFSCQTVFAPPEKILSSPILAQGWYGYWGGLT